MDGLPTIDHATLDRMPVDEQRELLALLDRDEALRARDDFAVYCQRVIPGFIASPFHREICELLMAVERGDYPRLLIEAPVRFGKTRIAAQTFPAWAMARRSIPTMLCSYGGDLATESGRKLRTLILGDAHRSVFPEATMNPGTTRADAFELANGSSFLAAGTGGPIMGRGWKLGILDDLLKGREAADSAIQREAVWTWYESDFMSREEFPSGLIFVGARWSDDDPAGRIRDRVKDGIEEWEIRTFAALDENDESLCEELRPAEELKRIRSERPARFWQSMYQSNPVADEGDVYRRDWFLPSARRWTPDDMRAGLIRVYAASDIATQDGAGDWTVHVVFGMDPEGLIHIIDVWRRQASSAAWIAAMLDIAATWRPLGWCFGAGALFRMAEPMIRQEMQRRGVYVALVTRPETVDKVARSQTFAALMENSRIRWDQTAPWYAEAQSELLRFPAGRTDDVADACSLAGMLINSLAPGTAPEPPPPPPPIAIIGDYEVPEGMRGMTWREVVDNSMAKKRRRARRPYHY